jgi:hypothetical protein
MPYADWAGVTRDLLHSLEELPDHEFLILGESPCRARARRRLFGRTAAPAPTRYVQALRVEDVFSAECVGATTLGGTWEMPEATIEQLCGLGWLTPQQCRAAYGDSTPNFELYVELSAAPGLADLMVASLALLGATPQSLGLDRSGGLSAVGG